MGFERCKNFVRKAVRSQVKCHDDVENVAFVTISYFLLDHSKTLDFKTIVVDISSINSFPVRLYKFFDIFSMECMCFLSPHTLFLFPVEQVTVNVSGEQLNNFVNPTYRGDQSSGVINTSSVCSLPVQVKGLSHVNPN